MQSLKNNPPKFLRSTEQYEYYVGIIDTLTAAKTPIRDQDSYAIGLMALNLALMDDCAQTIDEDGMMMKVSGDRGIVSKINPAVAMQKEAQTALRYYFDRFQMSPSSRGNGVGGGLTPQPKGKGEAASISSIKVNQK
jgi:P27 family predicted phage terminase small subunit